MITKRILIKKLYWEGLTKMKKVLIITIVNYGFIPFNKKNNVYVEYLYKRNKFNLLKRMSHKLLFSESNLFLSFPIFLQKIMFRIVFSNWFKLLKKVDTVIIFDGEKDPLILKMIHNLYPTKRLLVWYWNSIGGDIVSPDNFNRKYTELWSFDPQNCKDYNLKYNVQFYPLENVINNANISSDIDLLYVGADKTQERINILEKIKKVCLKGKINFLFYLVKQSKENIKTSIAYYPLLKYPQVLQLINRSSAILDITKNNQSGLTLRPLEALFFNKKLVTNNEDIIYHKIYKLNSANIYILGKEKKSLKEFIELPLNKSNTAQLKKYYSFDTWLSNFFK